MTMPKTTLRELSQRLDRLEQEVLRLRQGLGLARAPAGDASHPVDLDAALDRFFESVGIQGELSGLAQLRVLQANQEQLWAQRRQNGPAAEGSSPQRNKKTPGRGG
jgi:hypothetical protein